jgi:hypothetical protein
MPVTDLVKQSFKQDMRTILLAIPVKAYVVWGLAHVKKGEEEAIERPVPRGRKTLARFPSSTVHYNALAHRYPIESKLWSISAPLLARRLKSGFALGVSWTGRIKARVWYTVFQEASRTRRELYPCYDECPRLAAGVGITVHRAFCRT